MKDFYTDKNGTHYKKVGDRYRRIIDNEMFDSVDGLIQWEMNPNYSDGKDRMMEHFLEKSNNRHIHLGK